MPGSNLATCQLATWDENAVKFEFELSNENGRRKQTKASWGGVGDTKEMTWKVEIEVESRREVLW